MTKKRRAVLAAPCFVSLQHPNSISCGLSSILISFFIGRQKRNGFRAPMITKNHGELLAVLCCIVSCSLLLDCSPSTISYLSFCRLDSLEREEEANEKRKRKIAQAKAKQPIAVAVSKIKASESSMTNNNTANTSQANISATNISMVEPPPRPRIWNNLTSTPARSEGGEASMMNDDSSATVEFSP